MVTQTSTNEASINTVKQTTTAGEIHCNYLQIVPMTFEEKVRMYMRATKLELARMLAQRDNLDEMFRYPNYPQPYYPQPSPWEPGPWVTYDNGEVKCSSASTISDCSASYSDLDANKDCRTYTTEATLNTKHYRSDT